MSKIEEIISAGIELGEQIAGNVSNWRAQEQALRDQIAAALADARREAAEQMRAECAKLARRVPLYDGGSEPADEELAQAIEDLPMPTGGRQAVLLTDEQILELEAGCGHARLHWDTRLSIVRAAELAVLAANNLEVRHD